MNTNLQLNYPSLILNRLGDFISKSNVKTDFFGLNKGGINDVCYQLMVKAITAPSNATAAYFDSVMKLTEDFVPKEWAFLADEPEGKKVLVDNMYLKVILIKWESGVQSDIHGHPRGGGLIKVLDGAIEEKLYSNSGTQKFISKNTYLASESGYIDDNLALHSVGNPFDKPAVTLHAYLKYR